MTKTMLHKPLHYIHHLKVQTSIPNAHSINNSIIPKLSLKPHITLLSNILYPSSQLFIFRDSQLLETQHLTTRVLKNIQKLSILLPHYSTTPSLYNSLFFNNSITPKLHNSQTLIHTQSTHNKPSINPP